MTSLLKALIWNQFSNTFLFFVELRLKLKRVQNVYIMALIIVKLRLTSETFHYPKEPILYHSNSEVGHKQFQNTSQCQHML